MLSLRPTYFKFLLPYSRGWGPGIIFQYPREKGSKKIIQNQRDIIIWCKKQKVLAKLKRYMNATNKKLINSKIRGTLTNIIIECKLHLTAVG